MGSSGLVLAPTVGELAAELTERAGDGLPRRGFAPPRNDRRGDAGPLRPLRGHLPQGGRQGSLGFSGPVLAPPVGADSPYQGEMSRRDKRDRDSGTA